MEERIREGRIPTEATAALWITNQGLESSDADMSFEELVSMLLEMGRLAERLSTLRRDDVPAQA
jgi:hypothetical protein